MVVLHRWHFCNLDHGWGTTAAILIGDQELPPDHQVHVWVVQRVYLIPGHQCHHWGHRHLHGLAQQTYKQPSISFPQKLSLYKLHPVKPRPKTQKNFTRTEDFKKRVAKLKNHLLARGYKEELVDKQLRKAMLIPRTETLKPHPQQHKSTQRVTLVITYHPALSRSLDFHFISSLIFISFLNTNTTFTDVCWLIIKKYLRYNIIVLSTTVMLHFFLQLKYDTCTNYTTRCNLKGHMYYNTIYITPQDGNSHNIIS